ncbi:MAG TPA: aldo/keto reductase [Polyangia bacterium]
MKRRAFGWTGVPVPVIGQGTWKLEADPRAQALAAIRRGLDAGMTHVDTAEIYGEGRVEELVGEALLERRDEVFLVTKVAPGHASYAGTIAACEASLARLRTDHVDCLLLHWPGTHPLEDTIAAFERLVEQGKTRCYGVSNFDARELDRAVALAGAGRIACNQVLYNLADRFIERDVLPECERHAVAVVGYSPFGSGRGRLPAPASPAGRALAAVAGAHDATVRQVVLAFLTRHDALFAIPKSGDPAHVDENARAGDLTLTAAEAHALAQALPAPTGRELPTI